MRTIQPLTRSKQLTTTQAAILGLLTFGERSGYALRKLGERSVGFFWAPAKGHIYAVLPRLVELGYATRRRVEGDPHPGKQLYSITATGEEALRSWLVEAEVAVEPCPNPFMLKLFFGAFMDPDAVRAIVQDRRDFWHRRLGLLHEIERGALADDDPADYFPLLTLHAGVAETRTLLEWADQVLAELEERNQ